MTLDEFLTDAASRSADNAVTLTIRDLLGRWGAKRRDAETVQSISSDLAAYGLQASPSFEVSWIDTEIKLIAHAAPGEPSTDDWEPGPTSTDTEDVSLTVSSLQSATAGVTRVRPDESVIKARSLMHRHDFSQLPVMKSERALVGVISWESIAKGRLDGDVDTVSSVLAPAATVALTADLLASIPRIIESGYVFVEDNTKRVTGIVTTSDLSQQFELLAGPFLLIGETERRLRRLIDKWFAVDTIRDAVHDSPERRKKVVNASGLTIGEMMKLFEPESNWKTLSSLVDRKTFLQALDEMRRLRNDIMHFNPDPLDQTAINGTRQFAKWLEYLDGAAGPTGVSR